MGSEPYSPSTHSRRGLKPTAYQRARSGQSFKTETDISGWAQVLVWFALTASVSVTGQRCTDSPLPNISVRALAASRDGSVWIGFSSAGGVSRFQNRRLTNYLPNEGPPSGVVSAILEDSSGAIWVSASGGLSRFVNDRWETIGLPDGTPVRGVVAFYEDRFNNLWLSASGGTFRRPAGAATFQPVPSPRRTDAYTNDALFITGEYHGTLDDSGLLHGDRVKTRSRGARSTTGAATHGSLRSDRA